MQHDALAPQTYLAAIEKIEQALDGVVDHGSDDDLFIASYLQGHFAVESKRLEMNEDASIAMLNDIMQASLENAFAAGELEAQDQTRVLELWLSMVSQ